MNLLQETKLICQQYGITPTKSKGQNFLINQDIYEMIVETAELSSTDTVLEVGPGLGLLTRLLTKKAKQVIAVELDKTIFDYLQIVKEVEKLDNLTLTHRNILDVKLAEFSASNFETMGSRSDVAPTTHSFKIVANLPYNITSIFLRKFLTAEVKPQEMVLMLQKEVAERIVAKPGELSLLALSVQFYADAQIIFEVGKENFWPQPQVDSAVIRIKVKGTREKVIDEKRFFQIIKIGFSAKRKKLVNNLANGLHVKSAEILEIFNNLKLNPNARAQELSLGEWEVLVITL